MTKYDIMFEKLQEKVEEGELTLEQAEQVNDIAYEMYKDDTTDYGDYTMEGANLDMLKEYREGLKDYKDAKHAFIKAAKANKKIEAKLNIGKMKKALEKAKKGIETINAESNVGTAILGTVGTLLIDALSVTGMLVLMNGAASEYEGDLIRPENTINSLLIGTDMIGARNLSPGERALGAVVTASVIAGLALLVKNITKIIGDIKVIVNDIKHKDKDDDPKTFNMLRVRLIASIDKAEKEVDRFEKKIK